MYADKVKLKFRPDLPDQLAKLPGKSQAVCETSDFGYNEVPWVINLDFSDTFGKRHVGAGAPFPSNPTR